MVHIGLQLYSVRSYLDEDFLGTLRRVKQAGFDCLEFAGFYGLSAAQMKAECEQLGLLPYSAHIPFDQLKEDMEGTLAYATELGLRYVIIPHTPADSLENCRQTNILLKKLVGPFSEAGIRVGYHNHWNEFQKYDDRYALDIIMDGVDGIYEIDTAWLLWAGLDNVTFMRERDNRIGPIHAKDVNADYKKREPEEVDVGIGEGIVDFPAIIALLREMGTLSRGLIIEQEAFTVDPFESLTASVRELRRLVGEE